VIKNKKNTKPQVLELKTETVIHLSRALLKNVVGGETDNSMHPSQCVTFC
jgi:hypothetical protein